MDSISNSCPPRISLKRAAEEQPRATESPQQPGELKRSKGGQHPEQVPDQLADQVLPQQPDKGQVFSELLSSMQQLLVLTLPALVAKRDSQLQSLQTGSLSEQEAEDRLRHCLKLHAAWCQDALGEDALGEDAPSEDQCLARQAQLEAMVSVCFENLSGAEHRSVGLLREQLMQRLDTLRKQERCLHAAMEACMTQMPRAQERRAERSLLREANAVLQQLILIASRSGKPSIPQLYSASRQIATLRGRRDLLIRSVQGRQAPAFLSKRLDLINDQLGQIEAKWGYQLHLLDPAHFHAACSYTRAERLLALEPVGSFLLRPEKEEFVLCVRAKNCIEQRGLSNHPIKLTELVEQLAGGALAIAVPDLPNDVSDGALLFNQSSGDPQVLLADSPDGHCCMRREENAYAIYFVRKQSIHRLQVQICEQGLQVAGDACYADLYAVLEKHVPNYRILRDQIDLVAEDVYYRELLPAMRRSGQTWMRISKHYSHALSHSMWVSCAGDLYKRGPKRKAFLVGSGGTKAWWKLLPFYSGGGQQAYIRGSLEFGNQRVAQLVASSCQRTQELMRDFPNDRRFLIPSTVTYARKGDANKGMRYSQLAPQMAGSCLDLRQQLSPLGRLRAARQMLDIQLSLQHKHWHYLDYKPENFLVEEGYDPDYPPICLSDFDFLRRVGPGQALRVGTPYYMEPRMLRKQSTGPDDVKVAEQFCFGMSLFLMLTGELPKRSDREIKEGLTLSEQILERSGDAWTQLDPLLQKILRACLLGETRAWKLPFLAELLDQVITCAKARELLA